MTSFSFFQDLLYSIFERRLGFTNTKGADKTEQASLEDLCWQALSSNGEISGSAIASTIIRKYEDLDTEGKENFFLLMAKDFDIDINAAKEAIYRYEADPSHDNLKQLLSSTEPRRQELFRKLNMVPGGTAKLVNMRAELLKFSKTHTNEKRIDLDFAHLFSSWFNKGFLVLRRIDWTTPAHILEKIIEYEAVHEIHSWAELRARLEPEDRRCFAFFHPVMPDDPLIFVEIALTKEISGSIQEVLKEDREIINENEATTAVFYSISNCQKGLKGVSFGNFLIKQVARDLSIQLPNLKTFVTLSPIPGFMKWLMKECQEKPDGAADKAYSIVKDLDWTKDEEKTAEIKADLLVLAAHYFLQEKRKNGEPIDPVARFHLGNGASLKHINWLADTSAKGLAQSAGMMVNYHYDLNHVEENHEAYISDKQIKTTRKIRSLLPAPAGDK